MEQGSNVYICCRAFAQKIPKLNNNNPKQNRKKTKTKLKKTKAEQDKIGGAIIQSSVTVGL